MAGSQRLALSVAVTATLALPGCSGGSSRRGGEATISTASQATAPVTATPSASTSAGPLAAAIGYVASTDELMAHSPIGRREIFRKLVSPAVLDAQADAFEQAASQLATTLELPVERLVWVEAPITASVVASTVESASVDVWTVSILGSPTTGSPQQVWRTVHVNLALSGGRWLVTSATADAGPTPAANELAMQAGWKQFQVVASWPAVVPGVGL